MPAEERMAWIRDRISNGASPDRVVEELGEAGWTESGAEQAVWQAIGGGLSEDTGRAESDRPRSDGSRLLPLVVSGLALVLAAAALGLVLTGNGAVATPVDLNGTDGDNVTPPGGDADTGSDTVTIEVSEGVLSAPSQRITPVPARLRLVNNDDQEYTVESGGLAISTTLAPGGEAAYDIGRAGTYTLSVVETGSEVSFTVG